MTHVAVWNSELKWTAEKTLCEKYFFLPRQIRQFWCNARFFILYDTEKRCFLLWLLLQIVFLNYSWKNWIGIIIHLFTIVCKYGVSTLQYMRIVEFFVVNFICVRLFAVGNYYTLDCLHLTSSWRHVQVRVWVLLGCKTSLL